jgi:hypothetical protein
VLEAVYASDCEAALDLAGPGFEELCPVAALEGCEYDIDSARREQDQDGLAIVVLEGTFEYTASPTTPCSESFSTFRFSLESGDGGYRVVGANPG